MAREIAGIYLKKLKPVAEHIVTAGSIRREEETVGDIEIVMIPKVSPTGQLSLLGDMDATRYMTDEPMFAVRKLLPGVTIVKAGDRLKRLELPEGMFLDLYICKPPSQWGVLFMIRTGPWQFSKKMTTPRKHSGFMPSQYRIKDGNQLWYKNQSIPVPTEAKLFELYEMDYIEPKDRWQAYLDSDRSYMRVGRGPEFAPSEE